MKTFLFFLDCSASALITLPSAESDLLMLAPSLSLSPVAPVLETRSEPAGRGGDGRGCGGGSYKAQHAEVEGELVIIC